MAPSGAAKKPAAAAKAKPPVTLKHLAATLAEEHELTKRAAEALLGDLVGTITKKAPEKGRAGAYCRPRNPAGQKARSPRGAQSRHRRSNQNQGKQESRVQGGQRPENGGMTRTVHVKNPPAKTWRAFFVFGL